MPTRRNATSTARGILRPDEFAQHATVARLPCDLRLEPWVENYWHLTWHLPPDTSYVSSTLPHPACTLSVELGHPRAGVGEERVVVTGVITERFDVDLRASGWVLTSGSRPSGCWRATACTTWWPRSTPATTDRWPTWRRRTWYDQAHFSRDFVGLVGVTPSAYRAD